MEGGRAGAFGWRPRKGMQLGKEEERRQKKKLIFCSLNWFYACLSLGHLQTKEAAWIEKRSVSQIQPLAQFQRELVHRLGYFITRGWPQLIFDRWCDAATYRSSQPGSAGGGLNAGVGFSSKPHRGGYCGMHVPGA